MSFESTKSDTKQSPLADPCVAKLEKLIGMQMRFEMQTEDSFGKVLQRFDEIEIRLNLLGESSDDDSESSSSESAWDIQKRAIYAEYTNGTETNSPSLGESTDSAPQLETDRSSDKTEVGNAEIDNAEADDAEVDKDGAENQLSMSENDRVEIEQIKTDLKEKLRQAEVELSISRAKISQEKADLANQAVEIERQNKKLIIDKQLYTQPRKKTKTSMLDRLTRHMKSSKNQNDSGE